MPELPEVETVRRGLNQVTLAQEIQGGDVLLSRTIAHPVPASDFLVGVIGSQIVNWERRAKYLLAQLQRGKSTPAGWLGVHLRMTGQLLWLEADTELHKHTRVRLLLSSGKELRFVDQRTFGKMWWLPPNTQPEEAISGIKTLGKEPFSAKFTIEYLTKQLKRRHRHIKTVLLDQTVVAGLGNIYADEVLFLSGIYPETLGKDLDERQIAKLHQVMPEVLQKAIASGGTTFSNFLNVQGVNGNYGGIAWVYNRTGQPCRVCGTPISKLKIGGRSSHFCPNCQSKS
ncbi:DNA-formamidopyrimidine glycosylase [Merismopedia glauca]|uniref:Formamidopyrimidine-DNA glycosylase n=1 Tax=Merismopedia glauca CCAP 1448/3 TaxID=1296344 RepID=A0A2T1C2P0_9CYAN|nr:DNA-formamidopyrimidine glycosylase [Merismopedia glauca]PSB02417.1 DNA-formamidopyrimidine glycosylase [Merismopedia glauca CCAP 1448/3]